VPLTIHDWSTTYSALSSSLTTLKRLDLSDMPPNLPFDESNLFPLFGPVACNLHDLRLPGLKLTPETWRVAIFSLLCKSLKRLSFGSATPAILREILPCFAESPISLFHLENFPARPSSSDGGEDPIFAFGHRLESWPASPPSSSSSTFDENSAKASKSLFIQLSGVDDTLAVVLTLGIGLIPRKRWTLGIGKTEEEKKRSGDGVVRFRLFLSLALSISFSLRHAFRRVLTPTAFRQPQSLPFHRSLLSNSSPPTSVARRDRS
jgi:hypothetical protein